MKKSSLLVLLLCACLLLTACKATDPDNLFEMPSEGETVQTEPKEFKNYVGTYPYGNIQMDHGNYLLLNNEVLFFYNENGKTRLYAYDLNTEEVRFYCGDATCSHNSCASGAFWYHLAIHEGKVYGLMFTEEHKGPYPGVVNGNRAELLVKADAYRFFHYEDMLYVATADSSLVKWKEGEDPQLVMEVFDTPNSVVTCGEYLYCGDYGAPFFRVKLTEEQPQAEVLIENVSTAMIDGKHIYYRDSENDFLYRCDLDGSNPECVLQQKIWSFNFDEEYVYYNLSTGAYPDPGNEDSYTVYRMRKDDPTRIEKVAVLPDLVGQIYTVPGTGTLFVTNWYRSDIVKQRVFVVNIDGTGMKMLDIPEP